MNHAVTPPSQRRRDGFATVVDLASRFDRPSPTVPNHCWRCGATGVPLVRDQHVSRRKRCRPGLPCVDRPTDVADRHCPSWCTGHHSQSPVDGRTHRSAVFESTVVTETGRINRVDARLVAWESPDGVREPVEMSIDGGSFRFRVTPAQARRLSNTLGGLAELADTTDTGLLKSA